MEWAELFLRPFAIIYSVVVVYIMDYRLIESRVSKRTYLGVTTLFYLLLYGFYVPYLN